MSLNDKTTAASGTGIDDSLQTTTIFETARHIPEISRFVEAIAAAGLDHDLKTPDFKTLFAPVNDSFKGSLDAETLSRHIVIGRQTEADLRTARTLRTLAGVPLPVEYRSEGSLVGGAKIVRRDIACVNGHIHVIEKPAAG
jgi:uncharacterized surface protein with fasciclin (FAS1) repeats